MNLRTNSTNPHLSRRISYWGKENPRKTQLIIVVLSIILGIYGYAMGVFLFAKGIEISDSYQYVGIVLLCVAFLCYPKKGMTNWLHRHSYVKQKSWDFFLIALGTLLWLSVGNQRANEVWHAPISMNEIHTSIEVAEASAGVDIVPQTRKQKRQARRTMKKNLKKQIKTAIKSIKKTNKGNGGWIAFVIILAVMLWLLLAVLSCTIECSGNPAAGVALLIIGTIGIIVGAVFAIIAISKRGKKEEKEKETTSPPIE